MCHASDIFGTSVISLVVLAVTVVSAQPIVPALIIFGDSILDVGNNNNLNAIIKANFPPYGRDFVDHRPTGRFCNGKLAVDITAEYLGFNSYPPAYLSREARGSNILSGVNFASAASGFHDGTSKLYGAISLTKQLSYYKKYQIQVVSMVGQAKANKIYAGAIHLLSAGSSDFLQNYYINLLLNLVYSTDQFSDILMTSYSSFIQNLYQLGARRIGVTSLPPIGCLPAAITLFGRGSNKCVERLNNDAIAYNNKLRTTSQSLVKKLPGLKLVVFDVYGPLMDIVSNPTDYGFFEGRKACCGSGLLETSVLCNAKSIGTCSNATEYVFWDGFHPSEAVNTLLAEDLLAQGLGLIS